MNLTYEKNGDYLIPVSYTHLGNMGARPELAENDTPDGHHRRGKSFNGLDVLCGLRG